MLTIKEKFEKLQAIYAAANAEAAPLVAELGPYLEAMQMAKIRELGPDSTVDEVLDAFIGGVEIAPQVKDELPSLITSRSAGEIEDAAKGMREQHRAIGAMLGNLVGVIAALK